MASLGAAMLRKLTVPRNVSVGSSTCAASTRPEVTAAPIALYGNSRNLVVELSPPFLSIHVRTAISAKPWRIATATVLPPKSVAARMGDDWATTSPLLGALDCQSPDGERKTNGTP